jgi:exosome complex component RRP46
MTLPQLELNTLSHSDGSATYTAYGCTVVASVNGPVEVTRRDELPEAATIDVAVRPAAGIGGAKAPDQGRQPR